MIDPDWLLVDLDPRTWRNIGRFFEPAQYIRSAQPGERGLFILHDNGRVLRVVDSVRGLRHDLALDRLGDPRELAARLYAMGEWQRIHVIDKNHLARVAKLVQATPQRHLTLDAYYHLIYNLLWDNSGGYVSFPPHPGHWHGWTYRGIKEFVDTLPEQATVVLGVLDEAGLYIGLIFAVDKGLIKLVTTFEALDIPPEELAVSQRSLDHLCTSVTTRFAQPAAALLCTRDVFEQWITADDKGGVITCAIATGTALGYLPPQHDAVGPIENVLYV